MNGGGETLGLSREADYAPTVQGRQQREVVDADCIRFGPRGISPLNYSHVSNLM